MTTTVLSHTELAALVENLVGSGTTVIAPVPDGRDWEWTEYRPIRSLEEAALAGSLPRRSLTEFFRPAAGVRTTFAPQVILGSRPCDAAGLETLDEEVGWDYHDEPWRARRQATTIVSIACNGGDGSCFCSAVGLGPDSARGSDILLVPLAGSWGRPPTEQRIVQQMRSLVDVYLADCEPFAGAAELQVSLETVPQRPSLGYLAHAFSPKGEALLAGRGIPPANRAELEGAEGFVQSAREAVASNLVVLKLPGKAPLDPNVEARLGIAAADGGELVARASVLATALPGWLAENSDDPLWESLASQCRGCGACEEVCSSHFARKTPAATDASAEPRHARSDRFRRRVMDKFCTHPRRFDAISCTGCGRCARVCEAGMNLPAILGQLVQRAGAEI